MTNVKLLIIEDDPDQVDLIRTTLEDHYGPGSVESAGGIRQALSLDLASFDMILCDYNLPDGSGIDFLDEIAKRCTTPVIIVTGENVCAIADKSIRHGATDYIVKVGEYIYSIPVMVEKNLAVTNIKRENESLRLRLENTLGELREKNTQLEQSLIRLEELAATDPLTGLYNRRHFGKLFEKLFAEAQRYGNDLSCVMIDLDGYKQLNDGYGHQMGDQLLVLAGNVIRNNLRKMDTAARYGGDEFVLLLPRATGEEAAAVMDRIREEFRTRSAELLKREYGVSMSAGVASMGIKRYASADQLVAMADKKLYEAKGDGRGKTVVARSVEEIRAVG